MYGSWRSVSSLVRSISYSDMAYPMDTYCATAEENTVPSTVSLGAVPRTNLLRMFREIVLFSEIHKFPDNVPRAELTVVQ